MQAYGVPSGSNDCTNADSASGRPYRPATRSRGPARGIEAAVLPLAVAAAAAGLLAIFARAASAAELARFAGLALLGLSAYALIARADRGRAGHGAAVVALPAGAVLLPLDLLVSLALVISVPRWLWPHAPRLTRAVELASEVVASIASWLTAAAAHALAMVVLDGEGAWALAGMVACATFVGDGPAFGLRRRRSSRAGCRICVLPRSASARSSCSQRWELQSRPCA